MRHIVRRARRRSLLRWILHGGRVYASRRSLLGIDFPRGWGGKFEQGRKRIPDEYGVTVPLEIAERGSVNLLPTKTAVPVLLRSRAKRNQKIE